MLTLLSQYGAGVAPVTPGYGSYHVLPQMGPLKYIKTVVPTVKGEIKLQLDNQTDYFPLDWILPHTLKLWSEFLSHAVKRYAKLKLRVKLLGSAVRFKMKSQGYII